MGTLTSRIHTAWGEAQGSTLEDRIRYTPKTSFGTFPWPSGNRDAIGDVGRRLIARRGEICVEQNIGLTKLYNQMDDGAWKDLRDLHRELDEAVAVAYGWPKSVAHDPKRVEPPAARAQPRDRRRRDRVRPVPRGLIPSSDRVAEWLDSPVQGP